MSRDRDSKPPQTKSGTRERRDEEREAPRTWRFTDWAMI